MMNIDDFIFRNPRKNRHNPQREWSISYMDCYHDAIEHFRAITRIIAAIALMRFLECYLV